MFTADETRRRNAIFKAAINALGDLPDDIEQAYNEHATVPLCDTVTGPGGARVLFEGGVDVVIQAVMRRMENRPLGLCMPDGASPTLMKWPDLTGFTPEAQACAEMRLLCEGAQLHVQRLFEKTVTDDPQADRETEFLMSACVQTGISWARQQAEVALPYRGLEVLETVGFARSPAATLPPLTRPAPTEAPRP